MAGGAGEETLARVRLNAFACNRCDWLLRLMELRGGAAAVLRLRPAEIAAEAGVALETAERLKAQAEACDPEKELLAAAAAGAGVLTLGDPAYPELLKKIYDPPLVLYVRGGFKPLPAAGVVGTRRASAYGLRTSARLAAELAGAGVAVVSGLARGIDTAAHKAAVEAGGVTWAALGTGLGMVYPAENARLAERIVESGGALVSEFPMDFGPHQQNFPRRNRIISGLSLATVVVEGKFGSGALITARFALEQGREVLAVPGPVDSELSRGPNYLIKNGAFPAETADDVTACFPPEYLFGVGRVPGKGPGSPREALLRRLSPDALAALEAVGTEAAGLSADELTVRLAWPVQRTAAALFELEAESAVLSKGGRYCGAV
ncbi:MAG: DNA-processing protein DprA [Elusimicrobia bacterium]|nr:DNA-processing protein DprA [Elusimicrobiota bacterium]